MDEQKGTVSTFILDTIINFAIALALFVFVYFVVAVPHKVDGNSMLNTFFDGDYLLTEKLSHYWDDYTRFDDIVFHYPKDTTKRFIKRIIALPGEVIRITNGTVYINDIPIDESYTSGAKTQGHRFLREDEPYTLGEEEYIVMGDNRTASSDSREWGPVNKSLIVGKVVFRYWPLSRFGLIKGV